MILIHIYTFYYIIFFCKPQPFFDIFSKKFCIILCFFQGLKEFCCRFDVVFCRILSNLCLFFMLIYGWEFAFELWNFLTEILVLLVLLFAFGWIFLLTFFEICLGFGYWVYCCLVWFHFASFYLAWFHLAWFWFFGFSFSFNLFLIFWGRGQSCGNKFVKYFVKYLENIKNFIFNFFILGTGTLFQK